MSSSSRHALHDTLPGLVPQAFPGYSENAPLDLPPLTKRTETQLRDLLLSRDFDAWSEALARVGNCAHPIRLVGQSQKVDATSGKVLSTYSSRQEPLGVTYVRCGNRRADQCSSCSRLHAGDTYHLIHAGIAGGKTVPETVADNPLVFATVTAPSFGPVHGRRDNTGRCHPHVAGPVRCQHGRPRTCQARHTEDDPALGQPLCGDCYDYGSHLVWQWWSTELWKRFTIKLRRLVAQNLGVSENRLAKVATVQYAKVAEYQLRGLVHFHALFRARAWLGVDDGPRILLVGRQPVHDRSRRPLRWPYP